MKRHSRILLTLAPLLLSSLVGATDRPATDAYARAPRARTRSLFAEARTVASPAVRVLSRDTQRNTPTLVLAEPAHPAPVATSPAAAALEHLTRHAPLYGLAPGVLDSAFIESIHDTGHGGIIVTVHQQIGGIELYRSAAKVLLARDLRLIAIGGNLHADAVSTEKYGSFSLSGADAVAVALSDLHSVHVVGEDLFDGGALAGGYRGLSLSTQASIEASVVKMRRPARFKPVYFPLPEGLVPAYFLELSSTDLTTGEPDAYAYVIAATDGRILQRTNLTHTDAFSYRVWADPTGDHRPSDGPLVDTTPYPAAAPNGSYPGTAAPALITIDGFNVTHDPWLAPGATETNGNNVDAYTHNGAPGGFTAGDLRATTTSPGVFDRVHDTTLSAQANDTQKMASVTSLFYATNWLHDWYYDSGFDEKGHNAQASNYGRGGLEGDALFAQAQDNAPQQRNNSNMAVYGDGESPEMHMFVWDGRSTSVLHVSPPNADVTAGGASFGPANFDVTAAVSIVSDGSANPTQGCNAITSNVSGKIALIDRGSCTFKRKALNAQNAGAVGVIVVDNVNGSALPPLGDDPNISTNITTPVMVISLASGSAIKNDLMSGAVTAHMLHQAVGDLDGTIDNTVVAHEWGHYLHLRNVSCASALCAAESEGWADFVALHMVLRPGDDLSGAYALAQYATGSFAGDPAYFGIRRYPYSTDFSKNPLTFKHITDGVALPATAPVSAGQSNNAEAHAAGEIWASMLFEAYVAMLEKAQGANPPYTFDEARRRMSDYVVAGLALAPADPTYTEQRDAILAAASAVDPQDVLTIAQAFARRGAGSCAVSPARDSTDFLGVVEDFTVGDDLSIVGIDLDDTVISCDNGGHLDAGETGLVTVTLKSNAVQTVAQAKVSLQSAFSGVSFPMGAEAVFTNIPSYGTAQASVQIAMAPSITGPQVVDLSATLTEGVACASGGTLFVKKLANYAEAATGATTDTVEASLSSWTPTGDGVSTIWTRLEPVSGNHVWSGLDAPYPSDTSLESPQLNVSATAPFTVSFKHRYQFETSQGTYWDGAVIELSDDGGASWADISSFGAVGYNGVIGDPSNQAVNALKGRMGFVDHNDSFPDVDLVSIDMGTTLAGKNVRFRFRIGTDNATGALGWEIDDITVSGVDNAPFSKILDQSVTCAGGAGGTAGTGGSSGASGSAGAGGSSGSSGSSGTAGSAGSSAGQAGTSATGGAGAGGLDGSAGTASNLSPTNENLDVEGGCGCKTPTASSWSSSALVLAMGAMVAAMRRRKAAQG